MKYYPADLPRPLQNGYSVKHKPNVLRTTMADGYTRQRLVNQGAPDEVQAAVLLTAEQYRYFLRWYKADILSGASWFIMPLLSVDEDAEIQYRYVRIQNGALTAKLMGTNRNTGSIYQVQFALDASNTVVDDGSWSEHYTIADDGGEIGEYVAIAPADVIDDREGMEDQTAPVDMVE